MTYDEILALCKKAQKWVDDNVTCQDIELLSAIRMRTVSIKATVGEMLANRCRESAFTESRRRGKEDIDRYREYLECDNASRADLVAKKNAAAYRAEEILALGEEKAVRVLWNDLSDILDTLNQRIAILRTEWNERNKN